MINSKQIEDLHPVVRELCKKHIDACAKRGIKIIVTSTLRDQEYQSKLYAQGRSVPGNIVTNMPLIGPHGFGMAYDVVPVVDGQAVWNNNKLWSVIGEEGKKLGFTWGGDWKSIVDKTHFEYTGGLTAAQLRAGMRPKWWNDNGHVPATQKGLVTASVLNVRNAPSMAGAVVGKLARGAEVSIYEARDGWYRIAPNQWVSAQYVKGV